MKITIIGSMKFYTEYEKLKEQLEKQGHKVIIPLPDEFYEKSNNELTRPPMFPPQ